MLFGIPNMIVNSRLYNELDEVTLSRMRIQLDKIEKIFNYADENRIMELSLEEQQFLDYSRRGTTDQSKRISRTDYISKLLVL